VAGSSQLYALNLSAGVRVTIDGNASAAIAALCDSIRDGCILNVDLSVVDEEAIIGLPRAGMSS
jgi:invasion protein IalB